MKIHVDVNGDGFAPLYHRYGGAPAPQPAFLELDPEDGRVSFGVRRDHVITRAEDKGLLLRWKVPSELRGSHCFVVAEALTPLLQTVQDGYFEEVDESEEYDLLFVGYLDDDAKKASAEISSLLEVHLIDPTDSAHVVTVWDPDEFVLNRIAQHVEIGPTTTNEELVQLAQDYLDEAKDEGVLIEPSLIEALIEFRDAAREDSACTLSADQRRM